MTDDPSSSSPETGADEFPATSTHPSLTVTFEDDRWTAVCADPAGLLLAAVEAACLTLQSEGEALDFSASDVSIVLSDNDRVAELNAGYRGKNTPTNVLSFPALAPDQPMSAMLRGVMGMPVFLGDIILARGVVVEEAATQGKAVADHLTHLVIHGFLHLLGHDHADDAEADAMEALEVSALARLGVADPYAPLAEGRAS